MDAIVQRAWQHHHIFSGLWLALILFFEAPVAKALDFDIERYLEVQEVNRLLRELAASHRDRLTLLHLGFSKEGRELLALRIGTENAPSGSSQKKHNILINSAHHGNERISLIASLGLIKALSNHTLKIEDAHILDDFTIFIQPLVNPDGYHVGSRFNSDGIDPNRDYDYPGRPKNEAFRSNEARAAASLLTNTHFSGALAIHAGMEAVLWPWCYTRTPVEGDDVFRMIAGKIAAGMNMFYYTQSSLDYHSRGEFIDYVFYKQKALAYTLEVSRNLDPPSEEFPSIIKRTLDGTLTFLSEIKSLHAQST